jgi:hypothetical protein
MSASSADVEAAWGEYHPSEPVKPDDKGIGTWIWEALQGDYNQERTVGQISFDMVVSLIPVVDTVCDIRDLCSNIREYKKDPDNKLTMFFIALTVVGFIPEIGTIVKGIVKIVFAYLRKFVKKMDDLLVSGKLAKLAEKAADAALPKIYEFLQHSRWVRWATNNKVPDLFKFAAKEINKFADALSQSKLKQGFDEGIKSINSLFDKLKPIVPSTIREKIIEQQKMIQEASSKIRANIGQFVEPIRTTMRIIAKKLDDHYWIATTQTVNRGWIAPMSEGTARAMMLAKNPRYVSKITKAGLKNEQIDKELWLPKLHGKIAKFKKAHPGKAPPTLLEKDIPNFSHDIRASLLPSGTKLYRMVDPTNAAGGTWWISEADFKALMQMKQGAKDQWRKRFAILPDWNQDGKYVEYSVPEGGLPVWRGKTASQKVDEHNQLEGGYEQFYFNPIEDSYAGKPRVNPDNGQPIINTRTNKPDTRISFTDENGVKLDKNLTIKINDPNIKGPFDTGWGFDTIHPTVNGKLGLPLPPE